MWRDTECAKDKWHLFHANIHPKVTQQRPSVTQNVGRPFCGCQPVSSLISTCCLDELRIKWPSRQGLSLCMTRQHGLPLTEAGLATAAAKCQICQQQRPTLSHWCSALPLANLPADYSNLQADYTGPFVLWIVQHVVLTGINVYSGCVCLSCL